MHLLPSPYCDRVWYIPVLLPVGVRLCLGQQGQFGNSEQVLHWPTGSDTVNLGMSWFGLESQAEGPKLVTGLLMPWYNLEG